MKTGAVAAAAARHRILTLALAALLLSGLAAGIPRLTFSDNPLDAMPRGDPNTVATQELLERFPGSSYTAAVYVSVAPEKWPAGNARLPFRSPSGEEGVPAAHGIVDEILHNVTGATGQAVAHPFPGPHNITDEVYVRAIEELWLFLESRIPELEWGITLPSQVKLVNYTNTGVPNPAPGADAMRAPDADAFRMPATDARGARQYDAAWHTFFAAAPDSVRTITSPDWESTRLGLLFAPGEKRLDEIGSQVYAAVEAYREALRGCDAGGPCALAWNVFHPDEVIVDPRPPVAAASYLTSTTLQDVQHLAPYAALFILASLFVAFRRASLVAALVAPMATAAVGVAGMFGLLGIPIHSVSLLVFPIILGNGIDFAIHMAAAYTQACQSGLDRIAAAGQAGDRAGTPLAVATVTTVLGMGLIVLAPNRLLTQLGVAIVLGMLLLLSVSLTALPAALTFTRTPAARPTPLGRVLRRNAAFWHRHRIVGLVAVFAVSGAGVLAASGLSTLIVGTPAAYLPPGDAQRMDFDASNDRYFRESRDLVTNALVLQGDLTTPQVMDYLGRLEDGLRALPFVRNESTVSLRFSMEAWIQVREGTAGAPLAIAQEGAMPGSTFPQDQESIKALIDEMFATPLATYASFFVSQPSEGYDIGIVLLELYQAPDLAGLEAQWEAIHATVAGVEAAGEPSGLTAAVTGQSAIAYLFTKKELPYVQVAGLVGIALSGVLVWAATRRLRDAATVASVVTASMGLWLGTLALLDVPLSIVLVVPVVAIAAIGSDYALHLRYSLRSEGVRAWDVVGRAVVFAAVTDVGAFLVFTQMRYGLLAQATMATAAALTCSLLATLVLVPALARHEEIVHPRLPAGVVDAVLLAPRPSPRPSPRE